VRADSRQGVSAVAIRAMWTAVLASVLAACIASAAEDGLPADLFLAQVRQPFARNAWGRFSGSVQHRGPKGRAKMPIRLGLLFGTDFMRAHCLLDERALYTVRQSYAAQAGEVQVSLPEQEPKVGLADLGIAPHDITFSFLYWAFEEELAGDKIRGRPCRVMRLRHPTTGERVDAWFSAEYYFPLRVVSYEPNAEEPARTLEFTDFQKHENMWYIKSITLRGDDWKTQVKFSDGELALTEEQPPPTDLFPRPEGQ